MARKRGQVQSGNRESGERWGESRIEDRGRNARSSILDPRERSGSKTAPQSWGFRPFWKWITVAGFRSGGLGARLPAADQFQKAVDPRPPFFGDCARSALEFFLAFLDED